MFKVLIICKIANLQSDQDHGVTKYRQERQVHKNKNTLLMSKSTKQGTEKKPKGYDILSEFFSSHSEGKGSGKSKIHLSNFVIMNGPVYTCGSREEAEQQAIKNATRETRKVPSTAPSVPRETNHLLISNPQSTRKK
jgi:hypothetical protein